MWLATLVWTIVATVLVSEKVHPGPKTHPWPLAASLGSGIPAFAIFLALTIVTALSRTVLFTGTQAEAPTFWQKNGTAIIIGVGIAAVFYVLGLLT